jgi:hypothetical protein
VDAAGSWAAGSGLRTTALTADLQDGDSCESFLSKHSKASLPPGWTLAQCAMKSERHAERIASRSACVGSCAAIVLDARATINPASSKGREEFRMVVTRSARNGTNKEEHEASDFCEDANRMPGSVFG